MDQVGEGSATMSIYGAAGQGQRSLKKVVFVESTHQGVVTSKQRIFAIADGGNSERQWFNIYLYPNTSSIACALRVFQTQTMLPADVCGQDLALQTIRLEFFCDETTFITPPGVRPRITFSRNSLGVRT